MIFSFLDQILLMLPLVIGAYLTLSLLKVPDFSIESAYLFGAVMAYVAQDLPLPLIVISSALGGAFVGGIVSILNQSLKIPFLLSAILVNGFCHGITQAILGTAIQSSHLTLPFSESTFFICVSLGLLVLMGLILRSEFGYSLAICGSNPHFFRHHGISNRYVLSFGVMLGHSCAGIAGLFFVIANGFVDLTMNFGIVLTCLTTLILGKFLLQTPRPNLLTPIFGLILYFCIQQTLLRVGLNLTYFNAFQALFILLMLCLRKHKTNFLTDHLGV